MARINLNTIKRIEKDRNAVHTQVETTDSVFDEGGEKYVQIDTYGKKGQTVSQSLQLDRDSAVFLVRLLSDEFHLLP